MIIRKRVWISLRDPDPTYLASKELVSTFIVLLCLQVTWYLRELLHFEGRNLQEGFHR